MMKFRCDGQLNRLWKTASNFALEHDVNAYNIDVYGPIGEDYYDGFSLSGLRRALVEADGDDVVVNINSPGGSMFDGIEMYRLLREYPGTVTTRVGALAASAASVIAMAGDIREISRHGKLMIHRAWTYAAGNGPQFLKLAADLEGFDNTLSDIYAQVTGISVDEIMPMMHAETYIGADDAIEKGFATGYSATKVSKVSDAENSARADDVVDKALAAAGFSRSQRRELVKSLKSSAADCAGGSTPGATVTDTPSAVTVDLSETAAIAAQLKTILGN